MPMRPCHRSTESLTDSAYRRRHPRRTGHRAHRWTQGMVDLLKERWSAGDSASEAARWILERFQTRVSRNAVIGKVHRLKLAERIGKRSGKNPIVYPKRRLKSPSTKKYIFDRVPMVATPLPHAHEFDQQVKGATFEELDDKFRKCRWPIGDPQHADFKFCGEEAVLGKSYCAHHLARSSPRMASAEDPSKEEIEERHAQLV